MGRYQIIVVNLKEMRKTLSWILVMVIQICWSGSKTTVWYGMPKLEYRSRHVYIGPC